MPKNIVLCLDGTWNDPTDRTNVYKLYQSLVAGPSAQVARAGTLEAHERRQGPGVDAYYLQGVGAHGTANLPGGGALGLGLHQRVIDAYVLASRSWQPGDRLWIFGFSRGAWTARAVGALITGAGLLSPAAAAAEEGWLKAGELWVAHKSGHTRDRADQFWANTPTPVRLVGVWDTVGALGVPFFNGISAVDRLEQSLFDFVDLDLSPRVEHGRHALAIDEQRFDFTPTLWNPRDGVRQVWFAGVHADVGGGYAETGLSDIGLHWMLAEAAALGLALDPAVLVPAPAPDPTANRHDETQKAIWKLRPRKARTIAADAILDPSVEARLAARADYRPEALHPIARLAPYFQHAAPSEVLVPPGQPTDFTALDGPRRLQVSAQKWWNASGVAVRQGQRIRIAASGRWDDASHPADASGYDGDNFWLKISTGIRRVPASRWFRLIALVSPRRDLEALNPEADNAAIGAWQATQRHVGDIDAASQRIDVGAGADISVDRDGFLYFFANDVAAMYFNNRGSLSVELAPLP